MSVFSFASPATKTGKKIRVVFYPFAPDLIETKNGPQGAAYEVWENVSKKVGIPIEWVGPVPYLRALNMLETGKVDAIYRLVRTPEREKKFLFSTQPPFWGKTGITVLKTDPLNKITKDADIHGKKIGWLRGGTPPPFLERNKDKIAWESSTDNAIESNMAKLQNKRIWGAFFVFSNTALFYLAQHKQLETAKVIPFPGSEKNSVMYAAFAKQVDPEIYKKMDKGFTDEIPHYDYEKISQKYIDMAKQGLFKE